MSSDAPRESFRITAKLPNELIVKVAENLHYKDIRRLGEAISNNRIEKHLAEAGLPWERMGELPKELRRPSPLERMLQELVDNKRNQQILDEWNAETKRLEEQEALEKEHPYMRKLSK